MICICKTKLVYRGLPGYIVDKLHCPNCGRPVSLLTNPRGHYGRVRKELGI